MWECQPAPIRRSAALAAVLVALCWPSYAAAEGSVWTAAHLANLTTLRRGGVLGPGGQLGLDVGLGQFFAVTTDFTFSHHFANKEDEIPADRVMGLSAGLRYNFDVFKYVPFGGLSVTGYLDTPLVDESVTQVNAGAKLFLGIQWRFSRFWSTGIRGELHALFSDLNRFPIYTLAGVTFGYHFRL